MEAAKAAEDGQEGGAIDIFVFSNGQQYSPPRKFHLTTEDRSWWDGLLSYLARTQYGSLLRSSIDLYTIDGSKVESAEGLKNYNAYVAVIPPDPFVNAGYDKYLLKASRSWEKRQSKRISESEPTKPGGAVQGTRSPADNRKVSNVQTVDANIPLDIVMKDNIKDKSQKETSANVRRANDFRRSPTRYKSPIKNKPSVNQLSQGSNIPRKPNTPPPVVRGIKKLPVIKRESPRVSVKPTRQTIPTKISPEMPDAELKHIYRGVPRKVNDRNSLYRLKSPVKTKAAKIEDEIVKMQSSSPARRSKSPINKITRNPPSHQTKDIAKKAPPTTSTSTPFHSPTMSLKPHETNNVLNKKQLQETMHKSSSPVTKKTIIDNKDLLTGIEKNNKQSNDETTHKIASIEKPLTEDKDKNEKQSTEENKHMSFSPATEKPVIDDKDILCIMKLNDKQPNEEPTYKSSFSATEKPVIDDKDILTTMEQNNKQPNKEPTYKSSFSATEKPVIDDKDILTSMEPNNIQPNKETMHKSSFSATDKPVIDDKVILTTIEPTNIQPNKETMHKSSSSETEYPGKDEKDTLTTMEQNNKQLNEEIIPKSSSPSIKTAELDDKENSTRIDKNSKQPREASEFVISNNDKVTDSNVTKTPQETPTVNVNDNINITGEPQTEALKNIPMVVKSDEPKIEDKNNERAKASSDIDTDIKNRVIPNETEQGTDHIPLGARESTLPVQNNISKPNFIYPVSKYIDNLYGIKKEKKEKKSLLTDKDHVDNPRKKSTVNNSKNNDQELSIIDDSGHTETANNTQTRENNTENMLSIPLILLKPSQQSTNSHEIANQYDSDTTPLIVMVDKGDIVDLKLNVEVRTAAGILKISKEIDTRKSRSLRNISTTENYNDAKLTQSKSLQSVENEITSQPSSRKDQKMVVVQCVCCDRCKEDTNNRVQPSVNSTDQPCYILLPIGARPNREGNRKYSDVGKTSDRPVQTTESSLSATPDKLNQPSTSQEVDKTTSSVGERKPSAPTMTPIPSQAESTSRPQVFLTGDESVRAEMVFIKTAPSQTSDADPECICKPSCNSCVDYKDASTQTDWSDVMLEARIQPDGHYTFHLPPLTVLRELQQ